jgi:hypothetical protein
LTLHREGRLVEATKERAAADALLATDEIAWANGSVPELWHDAVLAQVWAAESKRIMSP